MPEIAQPTFAGGELAPSLHARIDLARYYTSLRTCRNFIVRPSGGVVNRPGSRLVSEVHDSAQRSRLIPFVFSSSDTYALEFGDHVVRVYYRGAAVRRPAGELAASLDVTGFHAQSTPLTGGFLIRLTVPGHSYRDGDTVRVVGVSAESDGDQVVLGDDDTYVYFHIDAGAVSAWSAAGTVAKVWVGTEVVEVATVWPASALSGLSVAQDADVMTVCHPEYPPQQLSRYGHADWRIADFANVEGPFQEMNIDSNLTVRTNVFSGNVTVTASSALFTPDMVGRLMKIEQAPDSTTPRWEVQKTMAVNDIRRAGSSYYQAVSAGTTGTVRPSILEGTEADGDPGVTWRYIHSGFGIVRITGYTSATVVTGVVLSRLPDSVVTGGLSRAITNVVPGAEATGGGEGGEGSPATNAVVTCPAHGFSTGDYATISGVLGMVDINGTCQIIVTDVNSFELSGVIGSGAYGGGGTAIKTLAGTNTYKWAFEAWGGDQGYPATSGYYQQRQIFGGAPGKPNQVHMSRSAGFNDFGLSNPILDDDAVTFSLNSGSVGRILHFVGLKQLVALTTEGPWIITKEQGNAVPTTDPQGEGGAGSIAPLKVGKQALYVEEKGGTIRALGYEFSSDTYEGKDLTVTADHLFEGRSIVSWAYQKVPFRCVWMVRDDGVMLGLTYLVEQEVVAWHRHDTDGVFESVCCVSEGAEDALYTIVRRTIGGVTKRYIERFASRIFPTAADTYFVDCGLSYDGRGAGATVTWSLTDGEEWSHEETLTFTTATLFFSGPSDVGDVLVVTDAAGGKIRLEIIEYASATTVKVLSSRTIPAELRATPRTGFDLARDTFAGLDHLEGKTVAILADGNLAEPRVVEGGTVSILTPAAVVHIGLPFVSDFETLDVNAQGASYQDRVKNINSVSLMVKDTRGLLAGPDENNLLEARAETSGTYDHFYQATNGILTINILSSWTKGGRVFVRQEVPLPATILAAIPQVVTGGT